MSDENDNNQQQSQPSQEVHPVDKGYDNADSPDAWNFGSGAE